MHTLRLEQDFIPVDQLGARAAGWLRKLARSDAPLVVTKDGKPAGVLLSTRAFDELVERSRFKAAVSEGLADAAAGRTRSHSDMKKSVRARLRRKVK
jgi:prevent-host-death family protein